MLEFGARNKASLSFLELFQGTNQDFEDICSQSAHLNGVGEEARRMDQEIF